MWPPPSIETLRTSQRDNYGYSKMIKNASRLNRKENQLLVKQLRHMELMRDENLLMMNFTMKKMNDLKILKPSSFSSPTSLQSCSPITASLSTNNKKTSSLESAATEFSPCSTPQKPAFQKRSTSLLTSLPGAQRSSFSTSSLSTCNNTTTKPIFRRSLSTATRTQGSSSATKMQSSSTPNNVTRPPFQRSISLAAGAQSLAPEQSVNTVIKNLTRQISSSSASITGTSTSNRKENYNLKDTINFSYNNQNSSNTKKTKVKFGAHSQNARIKKVVLTGLINQDTSSGNASRSMSLPYL